MTAWCDHVTVTPDSSRMVVLSSGMWKGLNGSMAKGGHDLPNSETVFSLL